MQTITTARAAPLHPSWFFVPLLMALALLAPRIIYAEKGLGTKFFECLDRAEIQMGICYLNADSYWDKVRCNAAQLIDEAGCVAEVLDELRPITDLVPQK